MAMFSHPLLRDSPRWKNMRIGLLGGSFNPPHEGHVHIAQAAIKALALDCVWWLVTPQNPLKEEAPLSLKERLLLCESLITHPRMLVTALEAQMRTTITHDSVAGLRAHYPQTDFVWISGMDNAHSLHRWGRWRELLGNICMAHLSRPPASTLVRRAPVHMLAGQKHIYIDRGGRYKLESGTTYWMMQKKMVNASSTAIRRAQNIDK